MMIVSSAVRVNIVKFSLVSFFFATLVIPAAASVTVNSPANGAQVGSPFGVSATAATCSSQSVASMGYSLDNSSDTIVFSGTSLSASVGSGSGAHTLHVKAWGQKGASCVTDVVITVGASIASSAIPSDAASNSALQVPNNWVGLNDSGSNGNSSGWTAILNSPSRSGNARKFVSTYSDYGDHRFSESFGDDTTSTNFVYDAWVYLPYPSTSVANLEMDVNQVMPNGQTVIFGFQCDGWSGTWDYTANKGTPAKPVDTWVHSGAACNPHQWSTNTWHHVQISYSRDDSGNVNYKAVWFDGAESALNVKVPSAFALGWAPALITNFQIDGSLAAGGTAAAYLDDLTIYHW